MYKTFCNINHSIYVINEQNSFKKENKGEKKILEFNEWMK